MRKLVALAAVLPIWAPAQEAPVGDVRLHVKPVLCVTDDRTPGCDLSFLIVWQSDTTGYYCLFNDFSADALRCWRDESEAELTDDRIFDTDFSFWMTGEDLARRLAQVEIEVLRLDTSDRRRRRRTRHVWDIQ